MKQKIILKVPMKCDKCRKKALKIAAAAHGVKEIAIQGAERDQLVVIGDEIDSAKLVCSLKKELHCAIILSVEEKKEEKPPPPPPPPPPPCCSACCPSCSACCPKQKPALGCHACCPKQGPALGCHACCPKQGPAPCCDAYCPKPQYFIAVESLPQDPCQATVCSIM